MFKILKIISKAFLAIAVVLIVSGCNNTSIVSKVDIAIPPEDFVKVSQTGHDVSCLTEKTLYCRNDYIALRLFEMDQNFADYKVLLSRGDAYGSLSADVAQIGLAAVGAVIPVSQTTKVLSAASAAVGLTNTAANKDLLLSQTIQVVEQEMSTLRASVRQTIVSRMACNPKRYPVGFILSDLQAYADAGTVTGALNAIAKSTANAQPTTNVTNGTATPTTTSTTSGSSPVDVVGSTAHTFVTAKGGLVSITYKAKGAQPLNCPLP